jgi:Arc/MetJ-type ribon-helix-helix transcriptional regulator
LSKGRPRKPEDEVYLFKNVRFPPDLWAKLEALVPARHRSAVIRDGLRLALRRLEREAKKGDANGRD